MKRAEDRYTAPGASRIRRSFGRIRSVVWIFVLILAPRPAAAAPVPEFDIERYCRDQNRIYHLSSTDPGCRADERRFKKLLEGNVLTPAQMRDCVANEATTEIGKSYAHLYQCMVWYRAGQP